MGQVVGLVMYDEGIIMLTASHNLETGPALDIEYDGATAIASSIISGWEQLKSKASGARLSHSACRASLHSQP